MLNSFIHQLFYSPSLDPGFFFSFVIFFTQTVGLLGRVISPSQGLYLNTGQHKHRINAHTDIHVLSGIRIHDPSFRTSENSSCLRPRGHCVRPKLKSVKEFLHMKTVTEICHWKFNRNYEHGEIKCAVDYSSDEERHVPGYDDVTHWWRHSFVPMVDGV
jgi:hypothetical protein